MAEFKSKTDAGTVESRVTSEEALASSSVSMEQEDSSHQPSMAGGSLHDPTPVEEVVQEPVSEEVELETPRIEDLSDADYETDFPESSEHMVCLLSARLPVLRDDESNRVLRAIRQFYKHPESHRKALGTLLHAALSSRRLVFGFSRPLLAKLLRSDPNVPSITAQEINSTLYKRVRQACHESGFITVLRDSEAGPRGRGRVAIFRVEFKPVQAAVCESRERSLSTLLAFQYAQVEAYRDGRVVPTREIPDTPSEESLMGQRFSELVNNRETFMENLQNLVVDLTGALISEKLARSAYAAVEARDTGMLGWSIKEIIEHFHTVGVQPGHLDQAPRYSVRGQDVASVDQINGLIDQLEAARASGSCNRISLVLTDFLKKNTLSHRQRAYLCAWLDTVLPVERKKEAWAMIIKNDHDGYPIPRPAKRR